MELYIVLAITLFMVVSFIFQKVPFGVTTMACCALMVLTGVMTVPEAFSGFCNQTVVLIAPILALSAALTKTSLVAKIRSAMDLMKGKRGFLLILFFYIIGAAFVQFIPATATISILIVFLSTLGNTGEITPKRLLLPLLGILCIWKSKLPIGMGATIFARYNALYEGIIPNEEYALQMLDPFFFSLVPVAVLTLYCLFAWRLLPKGDDQEIDRSALKSVKETAAMPHNQEMLVYIVFIAVMLVLVLNKWTGSLMYVAPAVGVLVLIYAKVLNVQEAVQKMTSDMIWMIAGVLAVADALGSSGAGELIGSTILGLLGSNPHPLFVAFLFSAVTVIMTTFISNTATMNVLTPVAASVALAGGWDPRGLVLIIAVGNTLALGFPSGAAECAVCYAAGNYNPAKVLKFTLPYIILGISSMALTAYFMYPVY